MSTPQPFVVGRSYRGKKTIEDSFSAVREGQVLRTEKYLSERAERGSLAKFKKILGKVPSIKPEAGDELSNS